jgi:hypothetical protein
MFNSFQLYFRKKSCNSKKIDICIQIFKLKFVKGKKRFRTNKMEKV